MPVQRKRYSAEEKTKVAVEAIKGQKTINELAVVYGVHPTQITQGKKQALDEIHAGFSGGRERQERTDEALVASLYQEIGQGTDGNGLVKKKPIGSIEEKRALIEPEHPTISIARQCELVDLARSSYYSQPMPVSEENLFLMRLLDEHYTRTPFYGIKKMTAWLRTQGQEVNHKRVARLLRQMGLMAVYPKPRLSQPGEQIARYPYLLRGLTIERNNQVWSTDITSIRADQEGSSIW
jgi:putative transposase